MMSEKTRQNALCVGRCGGTVSKNTICEDCLQYCHPSCLSKHVCTNTSYTSACSDNNLSVSSDPPELPKNTQPTSFDNLSSVSVTSLISAIKDLSNNISTMAEEQRKQREDINKFSKLFDELAQLRSENNSVKKLVISLNERIADLEAKKPSNTLLMQDTIGEIAERENRKNNLIVYNLPEASDRDSDKAKIEKELNKLKGGVTVTRAIRLKGREELPRPIKVTLDCPAKELLKNKKSATGINIKSDDTPLQRQYLTELKKKLQTRINDGETNLTIKYFNSMPRIVKSSRQSTLPEN